MAMEVRASWEGAYRCRVSVRQFELRVDEPPRHGGDDTGPQPTEVLLSAVAACFTLSVAHTARKHGIELPDLSVVASGDYEGLSFRAIRVEVQSSYPRDELAALVERAKRVCYVSNTLQRQLVMEFVVSHEPPPSPA
jgi:putative redox protein